MYPRKNGPIAIAKRLNIPISSIPNPDPNDEIFGNYKLTEELNLKYANELSHLSLMGYTNHSKNLRYLYRFSGNIRHRIDNSDMS